jgi:hypothetical protein
MDVDDEVLVCVFNFFVIVIQKPEGVKNTRRGG